MSRDAGFNGAACEISQHLVVRKGTANKKPPVGLFIVFSFMSLQQQRLRVTLQEAVGTKRLDEEVTLSFDEIMLN